MKIFAASIVGTAFASMAAYTSAPPQFVSWEAGGFDLHSIRNGAFIDAKNGLYIVTDYECDGGFRSIVLTTDKNAIVTNAGLESFDKIKEIWQIHKRTLTASTDRGIKLGMTPNQLKSVLGKPAQNFWSKKFQAQELTYKTRVVFSKDKYSYYAYYLFKKGKLYYIELNVVSDNI